MSNQSKSSKAQVVLYCQKTSVYKTLGCDVWDAERNALCFNEPVPIIAHPPCRLFSRLRSFSNAPACERLMAISAVLHIRRFGGILEHPYPSTLWQLLNLPLGSERDSFGGFTLKVNQSWFGHVTVKPTLIYIVGIEPSLVPDWCFSGTLPSHVIGRANGGKKEASKRLRSYTPIEFAKWLLAIHSLILASHIS